MQIRTCKVTEDITFQLIEILKLDNYPKCVYCGEGNYWNKTWPAALALSKYLAEEFPHEKLKNSNALVIGCGVGLEGLILAKLGATVSFLDHISDALQVVTQNCKLNDIELFQTICSCWRDSNEIRNLDKYDIVIGSDVLYSLKEWIWIESLLKITLNKKGLALFSDPMRPRAIDFFRNLNKADFQVKWADPRWPFKTNNILIYCIERL